MGNLSNPAYLLNGKLKKQTVLLYLVNLVYKYYNNETKTDNPFSFNG